MQGDQPYDKRQDADGDKELDHPGLPPHLQQPDKDYSKYRPKENVPYGTYIEDVYKRQQKNVASRLPFQKIMHSY